MSKSEWTQRDAAVANAAAWDRRQRAMRRARRRVIARRLVCRILEHKLGPELDGRILCERCGDVFDADMLREFEAVLGKPDSLVPPKS